MKDVIDLNSQDTNLTPVQDDSAGLTEEELKSLKADLLDLKEKELVARQIWTINDEVPSWATSEEYDEVVDRVYRDEENQANEEFTSPEQTDFQMVEEDIERRSNAIFRRILGAKLPAHKIEAARAQGRDIRTRKTTLLRRAHLRFQERVIWLGSGPYNIPGAATTGSAQSVSPIDSTGSGDTRWIDSGKTVADVWRDILNMIEQLLNEDGMPAPYDLALPQDRWAFIATEPIDPEDGDSDTVADKIQQNQFINQVVASRDLEDTDGNGTHTAVLVQPDPVNSEILLPMDVDMLSPWTLKNENIVLRAKQVFGGLTIFDANALVQMDGI